MGRELLVVWTGRRRRAAGLEILDRLKSTSSDRTHLYYWKAVALGERLGRTQEAITVLEHAIKTGYSREFTKSLLEKLKKK